MFVHKLARMHVIVYAVFEKFVWHRGRGSHPWFFYIIARVSEVLVEVPKRGFAPKRPCR